MLFAGACDDGADLDPDQCQRLFSLLAAESQPPSLPEDPPARLRQDAQLGDAVLLPSRVRITEPSITPLSATIEFWSEWAKPGRIPALVQAVENMRRQSRRSP